MYLVVNDLTFEVERLGKRPDQQTRGESKTQLAEQVSICLQSGTYSRALDLLRGAAAEFPGDAELSELEKLAHDGVKRNAEAQRLITESQELFAQQKSTEAIQLLSKAYELDKNNALARTILANALVEHAHSIVESNWLEAQKLANKALNLNPAHPTAKTILDRIVEQKEKSPVEDWVEQAGKLQSSGDLFTALAWVAEGLAVHPHDPKLLQIQDAIQRDQDARRRQDRRSDLEELRRLQREIDGSADVAAKQALAARIQAVAAKYWTDGEILSIANALLLRLGLISQETKGAAHRSAAAVILHVPRPSTPKASGASGAAASPVLAKAVVSGPVSSGLVSSSPAPPNPVSQNQIQPGPVLPSTISPGQVAASSPEPSQSAASSVSLSPALPALSPVPSNLAPPNPVRQDSPAANSDLPSPVPVSQVASENISSGTIPAGKIPLRNPPRGRVRIAPPEPQLARPAATMPAAEPLETAIIFTAQSAQPKEPSKWNLTTLILISAVAIVLVATISFYAGRHHAPQSANGPAAPSNVSSPAVSTPGVSSSGLSAPAVSAPTVATPAGPIADLSAPAAAIPESSPQAARLSSDAVRNPIPQDQIAQQKIRSHEGEQAKAVPNLQPPPQPSPQPQPRLASLTIQGGTPGTGVFVDQAPVGAIQPNGMLTVSAVNPGDHTVELRKDRFKPRQFKEHFVAGETISLATADTVLQALPAELKITYAPADAKVAIVKGDALTMVNSGVPLSLSPGTYTLTARTADKFTRWSTVEVAAGESKTLDLSLAPGGMSKWDAPNAWKPEKDAFIRKGGDFVLYGTVPASGTFVFSAMANKGHLLQWVLNYADAKNYVLCQLDDKNFYRTVIRNGEKTDQIKVANEGDKKSFRAIHIRVSPTEVVHEIQNGNSFSVVDRWTQPGGNLSQGKFGFYIPNNDEVVLAAFAHYADLNIR